MTGILSRRWIQVYIVPGAVFQSVMVGGGYGTGREIVEFFTAFGALGGLFALIAAYLVLAIVLALTFEFSRFFVSYDYRTFFKALLGRAWIAFELLIVLQFLLVLAVLASAAGNILRDEFGIPYGIGLMIMLAVVGFLTFYGRDVIARALTLWSLFLYAVFFTFFASTLHTEWISVISQLKAAEVVGGWGWSGFKYALYNVSLAPLLLYVARNFKTRSEALRSGVVAGAIAMVPAVLFHVAFLATYPALLDKPIPAYWMMTHLGMNVLLVVYTVMLFGTFIETGAGMLQGINERIDGYLSDVRGVGLPRLGHASIAVGSIAFSSALSLW